MSSHSYNKQNNSYLGPFNKYHISYFTQVSTLGRNHIRAFTLSPPLGNFFLEIYIPASNSLGYFARIACSGSQVASADL